MRRESGQPEGIIVIPEPRLDAPGLVIRPDEVNLENTVDRPVAEVLEGNIGSFTGTLKEDKDKAQSFLDYLRSQKLMRQILAVLTVLHLSGSKNGEGRDTRDMAPLVSYDEYTHTATDVFPFDPNVDASSVDTSSLQKYAPEYRATEIPNVKKDVQKILSFIQNNPQKKYQIKITGFSSFEGDKQKNLKLSGERADLAFVEIQSALEEAGINMDSLTWEVAGAGEHIVLDGHEIGEEAAYEYLKTQLSLRTNAEVDQKIHQFNFGHFDHPALRKLLVENRNHDVVIEAVNEVSQPFHPKEEPLVPGEENPLPQPKNPFSEGTDLIVRLPRRRNGIQQGNIDTEDEDGNSHALNNARQGGLNTNRLNRDGLDTNGLDRHGLDTDGLDRHGLDTNGLDIDGLDRHGLNRDGLNREELQREELQREELQTKSGLRSYNVNIRRGRGIVKSGEVREMDALRKSNDVKLTRGKRKIFGIETTKEPIKIKEVRVEPIIEPGDDEITIIEPPIPPIPPPPPPVKPFFRIPRGQRGEIQSMKNTESSGDIQKQASHGQKAKTGRGRVEFDKNSGETISLPPMVVYPRDERPPGEDVDGDQSKKARENSRNKKAKRTLTGKNGFRVS